MSNTSWIEKGVCGQFQRGCIMTGLTKICGWGRYPQQNAWLYTPSSIASLEAILQQENSFIARGMGRSYGDSANAPRSAENHYQ